jgi:heme-degrading monooxygenase HmoA
MYARSTSLQARPSSMDAGIDLIRTEVLPAVQGMQGCVGLSMMADRSSGRCIVTSAWESMAEMRASDAAVGKLRERAGKLLGGSPYVEEWEIAALHRHHHSHQGACVRAVWMQGAPPATPEGLEQGREYVRMVMLPALEKLEGFCSASLFVDPSTMRAVSSVTWDSRESMIASRDAAMKLRAAASTQLGVDILDVAEFDLLIAHLRVPEMA